MTKTVHYGQIEEGKLSFYNENRLMDDLRQFKNGEVEITVKKRGRRTNPQNRYYHGVIVTEIRHEFRNRGIIMDADTVHEFLKLHFNKQYIHDADGEVIGEYGGKTAILDKAEFGEYIDRIVLWAAEKLSLVIPPPNTQTSFFDLAA